MIPDFPHSSTNYELELFMAQKDEGVAVPLQRHRLSVLTGNVCEEFQIKTVTVSTLSLQLHGVKPSAHSKPSMPKFYMGPLHGR